MAMSVSSRYAVLSLDEDDDYSNKKKKIPAKKPAETKSQNTASIKSDTNFKKKKKGNLQVPNIKNRNKSSNSCDSGKKKMDTSSDQWEEWKLKDAQFVEGNYKDDLSQAILLSKMEYEEKKHLHESVKKGEEQKKNSKKNKKNQKFLVNEQSIGNKGNKQDLPTLNMERGNLKIKEESHKFKDSKTIEGMKDQVNNKGRIRDLVTEEELTLAQYEDTLERKDKEIMQLKEEVEKLKSQLHAAKNKNKKLCQIIANSEMKDKVEVLMEFERLQTIKDELSSEVISLHAQLEQERSKVRALSGNDHKAKDKNKKKHVISTESPE